MRPQPELARGTPANDVRARDHAARVAHRRFLDGYYGATRSIYDLTRAPYLRGRDRLLKSLVKERWRTLVEVGCGTGRNLRFLHARRAGRGYAGVEPCGPMRALATKRAPFARIVDGFAEDVPFGAIFDAPPDRILFSYALSMIEDPDEALAHARLSVAERGAVVVVDFGDMKGMPRMVRTLFRRWLAAFHVTPLPRAFYVRHGGDVIEGPLGYYRIARFRAVRPPHGRPE